MFLSYCTNLVRGLQGYDMPVLAPREWIQALNGWQVGGHARASHGADGEGRIRKIPVALWQGMPG